MGVNPKMRGRFGKGDMRGERRVSKGTCVASWNMRASRAAATRLLAAVMAWISPVMCRLNSSMGITCG